MLTFIPLGLIFVVDSNDGERMNEARDELMRMLSESELREAILLVFANKQVNEHFEMVNCRSCLIVYHEF